MRFSLMIAVFGLMTIGMLGCQSNKSSNASMTSSPMKMDASKDDCPFCPGVQHAKADGTCPECGMKVK